MGIHLQTLRLWFLKIRYKSMWVQKIKLPPFYDTFLYLNKELRFNDVGTKRDIAKCQYCQIPKKWIISNYLSKGRWGGRYQHLRIWYYVKFHLSPTSINQFIFHLISFLCSTSTNCKLCNTMKQSFVRIIFIYKWTIIQICCILFIF